MKKNNKGFLLAEVITVSVVTIVALVIIYVQFVAVDNSYYKSFKYNNVDKLYLANQLKQFINGDNANELYSDIENISYADITNCDAYFIERTYCRNLINAIDAKQVLVTKLDTSSILDKLKQNKIVSSDMYTFISNNKSLENGYRLIIEFNDNTYATLKLGSSVIYKDSILNGADPELKDNLVPVVINNDGTVKKADLSKEWYNYTNKVWANAVLLNGTDTYSAGDTIEENNIKAYYVWIPRYKYQIFADISNIETDIDYYTNNTKLINVTFESKDATKSNDNTIGSWLTHPAFTFGDTELNGLWVGKFELTGDTTNPTIKPNITSLRNQNVSTLFATTQKLSENSAMLKNIEWGAVAYLTTSIYGQGLTEVRINNSSTYITGCAATTSPQADNTYNNYQKQTDHSIGYYSGCENTYNTSIGVLASTTGNISGIYDMSGGTAEYVMAVIENSLGSNIPSSGSSLEYNSGFTGVTTGVLANISGITFPEGKYYDIYNYGKSYKDKNAYLNGKLGDATIELTGFSTKTDTDNNTRPHSSWNNDLAHFTCAFTPWFIRGGIYTYGASAGIFAFRSDYGYANGYLTTRAVLR